MRIVAVLYGTLCRRPRRFPRQLEEVQQDFRELINVGFVYLHINEGQLSDFRRFYSGDLQTEIADLMQQLPQLKHVLLSGIVDEECLAFLRRELTGFRIEKQLPMGDHRVQWSSGWEEYI